MRSYHSRLILVFGLGLVFLALTGVLLAQTAPWATSTVTIDPPLVDYRQTHGVQVTVSLTNTDASAYNVVTLCSLQSGEVTMTGPDVYDLGSDSVMWVGDVATETQVFTFTARSTSLDRFVVPCTIMNAGTIQQIVTGTSEVVPYQIWLPVILNADAAPLDSTGLYTWTYPAGNWLMQSSGSDLADAVSGHNLLAWRYDRTALTSNQPPSAAGQPYYLIRSLLSFDLNPLPAGKVISAWLELYTYNTWYGRFDLKFERGLWSGQPTSADWDAYRETLGVFDTGQWTTTTLSLTVPLPGLIDQPRPAELNLTLRGDETTALPIGALESLRAQIALQWPDNPLLSRPMDTPISRLHLIIAPETTP